MCAISSHAALMILSRCAGRFFACQRMWLKKKHTVDVTQTAGRIPKCSALCEGCKPTNLSASTGMLLLCLSVHLPS